MSPAQREPLRTASAVSDVWRVQEGLVQTQTWRPHGDSNPGRNRERVRKDVHSRLPQFTPVLLQTALGLHFLTIGVRLRSRQFVTGSYRSLPQYSQPSHSDDPRLRQEIATVARLAAKNRQTGVRIATAEARSKLAARREPYWVEVTPGTAVGYYKGERDAGWFVRQRVGGAYRKQRLGTPDDHVKADGEIVLSYKEAVTQAVSLQLDERRPAPRHYSDGTTLNDVFDQYLADRQLNPGGRFGRLMPKSTATVSRGAWNLRVRDSIGVKLVTALDAKALRLWLTGQVANPATNRGKALPFDPADHDQVRARRSTANRILTSIKASLTWARRHEVLPATMPDWWRDVQPFALGDEGEPRMLEADEITRLLNASPPDLRDLIAGGLMTGARVGELRALTVRDYDPETATVRIAQTKSYKTLQQPLTPEGVALLDRLTAGRAPTARIFTRADGSPWNTSDVAKPMRAAVAAARLEDVSIKTTRATYGKLLLIATKDIEMVARALGHSDSRITRKHYARYLPNEVARAVALLPSLGIATDSTVSPIGKRRRRQGAG